MSQAYHRVETSASCGLGAINICNEPAGRGGRGSCVQRQPIDSLLVIRARISAVRAVELAARRPAGRRTAAAATIEQIT
ncbi:hypothetical protein EVAR_67582_1 [Eumeta japonica]|uniref:Uncharacterized protein n=1 Tax=Eumeta variegata TaxID=151549 RepID=A0A4C2A882_EUMVA|nr:hypothetical protein EVAR_67582_1 [Eumeta japonica]